MTHAFAYLPPLPGRWPHKVMGAADWEEDTVKQGTAYDVVLIPNAAQTSGLTR